MKLRHFTIATAIVLSFSSSAFAQSSLQTRWENYRDNARTCAETSSSVLERWRCGTGRNTAAAVIVAAPVLAVSAAAAVISYEKGDDSLLKCVMKRSNEGCDEPLATRVFN